ADVNLAHAAAGVVDLVEAVAAETGHVRLHHAERECDGGGCVDGVAALAQHVQSGLTGHRVVGGDRPAATKEDRTVRALDLHRLAHRARSARAAACGSPRSQKSAAIMGSASRTTEASRCSSGACWAQAG